MAENNRRAARRRGKPRQGLTETEYARHLGISQSAVNQAKSKGRIVLHEDGSIDQEASDVIYFRETDLEQSERGRAQAGPPSNRSNHQYMLTRAKTMQVIGATQLVREKVARLRGEVVDRGIAANIVFGLARRERDAWLQWPARVAAAIAAELGTEGQALNIHTVQTCLERHVQAHLAGLPAPDPDPFPEVAVVRSEDDGDDEI